MPTVRHLQGLNAAVVTQLLAGLGLRTWTIDVDGVVVSTGLQVERAFRGFNPHQRKVPSYYPIMAHLAETTHILRVKNRSGNVHDGKAGLPFLRDLWAQLAPLRTGRARLRFRMDGAFFRQDVLRWLQMRGGRLCHQGPVLSLVGSAAVHPRRPGLGPGRAQRDRLRRAARGHAVADPGGGHHLPHEGRASSHEEPSAGSVRSQRRALRVCGSDQQPPADRAQPVVLRVRARQPRKDDRTTEDGLSVSQRPRPRPMRPTAPGSNSWRSRTTC